MRNLNGRHTGSKRTSDHNEFNPRLGQNEDIFFKVEEKVKEAQSVSTSWWTFIMMMLTRNWNRTRTFLFVEEKVTVTERVSTAGGHLL